MATLASDEQIAATPKKKALPFKRTVARKQQSNAETEKPEDDNELDLFRHSKEVFPAVLLEAREADGEGDQQYGLKRRKLSASTTDGPAKMRKRSTTSSVSDDDDLIMDVKGKGKEIIRPRRPSTPREPSSTEIVPQTPGSKRTSPRTPSTRTSTRQNPAGSPAVPVTISDSDSDPEYKPAASRSRQRKASSPPTLPHNTRNTSSSPVQIIPDPSSGAPIELSTSPAPNPPPDDFSEWVAKARAMQAAQSQQAVVQAIITSRLPGCTRPVLIRRRLNQGVQLLLDTWIANKRNGGGDADGGGDGGGAGRMVHIPDEVAAGLFLTWKGNKIYGHSTLASLGVQVDAQGRLRNSQGEGYLRDGIHLEVWTEEAYAEFLRYRGKERALMLGADGGAGLMAGSDREGQEEQEASPPPMQQRRKGIRIVLKAKEHEPLKLTTREDTNVEMLIEAFRAQRGLGPEWEVTVWFDGERLDEESLVTEIDIDPDEANQLEVHVKKAAA